MYFSIARNTNQVSFCVKFHQINSKNEEKRSDHVTEKVQELIVKIRKVCAERELNSSDVLRMVESHPEYGTATVEPISKSTVDAVLKDSPRTFGLKYSTIRPLVRVLLDVAEDITSDAVTPDKYDPEKGREYFAEREALRQVVLLKAAEESRLRARLEGVERESDAELKRITEYQAKTIAILEQNNAFLQQTIEVVRLSLCEERESKKRLYADVKQYIELLQQLSREVAEMRKYHSED